MAKKLLKNKIVYDIIELVEGALKTLRQKILKIDLKCFKRSTIM